LPLVVREGFSSVRKKGLKLHSIVPYEGTVPCEGNFSHHKHYFANSNGEDVRKCVSNLVSKFHDDPTVNEFRIVVLLG